MGGTFVFKGVDSPFQYLLLSKVLRLSIYVHLSLLLEQYLLSDSRVPINFPRPVPTHHPSTPVKFPSNPVEMHLTTEMKPRSGSSIFPSNLINAFRRSLSFRSKTNVGAETSVMAAHRMSFEGGLRRFSFIGEKRPPARSPLHIPLQDVIRKPFEATLNRVEGSASLLSTSTGVRFNPPKILVDLAAKEKPIQSRPLTADERIALNSLLGWDGKDTEGRGMSGTLGFVRYQELSVLRSQHIPRLPPEAEGTSTSASTVSSATSSNLPTTRLSLCGKPYWATYCYYSSGDQLLGNIINDLGRNADLPCERPGCSFTRGQHESRIIHGGTRIVIRIISEAEESADNLIQMWQSCAVCEAKTPRTNMHDGTLYVPS